MQSSRGDAGSGQWHRPLKTRAVPVARWSVELRSLPRELKKADVLVTELATLNLAAWRGVFFRQPTILWGHGKSYVNESSAFSDRLEWALARRANRVFTYAPSGRDYLVDAGGLDSGKVVSIGNSTDTAKLRSELLSIPDARWRELEAEFGPGPVALFVGGIDHTKRIDFLLEAFDAAVALDPNFRLIVAGKGELEHLVDARAAADPRLIRMGDVRGQRLAELAAVSHALWMPGRVGLVAVDALALGLPVHTTDFEFHAPEIEFLDSNQLATLTNDPTSFAQESLALVRDAPRGPGRPLADDIPTVQSVARNMVQGIHETIGLDEPV